MDAHIVYISYNGLAEPLGRRQVVPYVAGLASRGYRFTVLSFEKGDYEAGSAPVRQVFAPLQVNWVPLAYHRQPTLAATLFDVSQGIRTALAQPSPITLIHARSTVSAAIAWPVAKFRSCPWIFDVRGLVALEYADAGHWSPHGYLYRLTDGAERRLLKRATGLVFLTDRIQRQLAADDGFPHGTPRRVIPCCVDLDTFRPCEGDRHELRRALSLPEGPILVYSGSLGSWYLIDEMMDFFCAARTELPSLHFLVLTPDTPRAEAAAKRAGVAPHVSSRRAQPDEVPRYLAAADAGICFLMDRPSKRASSPTKYAEYLASGLPVITNPWTGDAKNLADEPSWILVSEFTTEKYRQAAQHFCRLLQTRTTTSAEARSLAVREFSLTTALDRYQALYDELAAGRR